MGRLTEVKEVKLQCDRCFYLTDPQCPTAVICGLEESANSPDPSERKWVEENLGEKLRQRRQLGKVMP